MRVRDLFVRREDGAAAAAVAAADPGARFLDRITEELGDGPINLPYFPDVVLRVRRALDDPGSSADDIVRIAGAEPRLAARLIQTANSVVFNPSGRSSPHLRAAVTRLGHHLVQSVAMVFAIQQMKADSTLRGVSRPLGDLWEKSIAVGSICQVLARQLNVPTDKVFMTGLLHGIGHFYILVRAAESESPVAYADLPSRLVAERHPAIGKSVLEKWGFETVVCDAVGSQRDYQRESSRAADITDVLIASILLAEVFLEDGGDLGRTEGVTAFDRLDMGAEHLQAVLKHTEHSIGSLRQTLSL